uniref:NADH-ubiquinone oxidoreductase chain 5 n=1 Tax=Archipsocus nomas TaxID=239250 RepID=A0A343QCF4_9NEOP|nr:NADH dehydrogenase subunit 5 [Archipsocus nomas]ATU07101.1 NADH dehydrogenase subunit 5 [Archipsocus nomas]
MYNRSYIYWSIFFMLITGSMVSLMWFLIVLLNETVYLIEWELMEINSCSLSMLIYVDWMSMSFMSLVMFISSIIVIYSISYMKSDSYRGMFILMVMFFVFSMLFLIVSPNLISILLGWDGLGLTSYCLVIYYQSEKSYNAGMVTVLTNRVGDVMILMCIAWMINFGSWNFIWGINYFEMVSILIVIAALTKSAQIPFSSWLPAAMAAPTPVSALVHSSTLVTAGVYLLIRFNGIFFSFYVKESLLILAVLTMFMSGLGASFEYDLKKIIALSTLSQLGLMMSCLCVGMVKMGFFHLLSHALFKSLLFMCAGYMIHMSVNNQDIRYMGMFSKQTPLLMMAFVGSNLSLCGLPFLSGFYSKDLILEMMCYNGFNNLIYFLYYISVMLTVCYTFRLIYYVVIHEYSGGNLLSVNDDDYSMLIPMLVMFLFTIMGGSVMMWLMFLGSVPVYLTLTMKCLTWMVILMGIFLGLMICMVDDYMEMTGGMLVSFVGQMWYLPFLSTYCLNSWGLHMGYFYYKIVDQGWLDKMGGQGMKNLLIKLSNWSSVVHLNKINLYILLYLYVLYVSLFIFLVV